MDDPVAIALEQAVERRTEFNQRERNQTLLSRLTPRERQVLDLIAAGKGNAVIAHELVLSLKTIRNHVSNIFTKLQVSDRAAAIVKARDAGFGAPARHG